MKEIFLETPKVIEESEHRFLVGKQVRRWTFPLYFCMITGLVSAFTGLFFGAVSYFAWFGDGDLVNQIGNLLIIAAFLLLMFAAHALDKISQIKKNGYDD